MPTDLVEPTRIYPTLRYRDAPTMIDWLIGAFGFEKHVVYPGPDDTIAHAQLNLGSGMIMVGSAGDGDFDKLVGGIDGPKTSGQAVYIAVDDTDALHDRARDAGAEIVMPPTDTDYGSRDFVCRDPEGYLWCFGTYWPKAHEPAMPSGE